MLPSREPVTHWLCKTTTVEHARSIKFLNEAAPDQAVLTLKSLEAFAKAADGKATKLIIPSEISGIAGLASSLTEIVTKNSES